MKTKTLKNRRNEKCVNGIPICGRWRFTAGSAIFDSFCSRKTNWNAAKSLPCARPQINEFSAGFDWKSRKILKFRRRFRCTISSGKCGSHDILSEFSPLQLDRSWSRDFAEEKFVRLQESSIWVLMNIRRGNRHLNRAIWYFAELCVSRNRKIAEIWRGEWRKLLEIWELLDGKSMAKFEESKMGIDWLKVDLRFLRAMKGVWERVQVFYEKFDKFGTKIGDFLKKNFIENKFFEFESEWNI